MRTSRRNPDDNAYQAAASHGMKTGGSGATSGIPEAQRPAAPRMKDTAYGPMAGYQERTVGAARQPGMGRPLGGATQIALPNGSFLKNQAGGYNFAVMPSYSGHGGGSAARERQRAAGPSIYSRGDSHMGAAEAAGEARRAASQAASDQRQINAAAKKDALWKQQFGAGHRPAGKDPAQHALDDEAARADAAAALSQLAAAGDRQARDAAGSANAFAKAFKQPAPRNVAQQQTERKWAEHDRTHNADGSMKTPVNAGPPPAPVKAAPASPARRQPSPTIHKTPAEIAAEQAAEQSEREKFKRRQRELEQYRKSLGLR